MNAIVASHVLNVIVGLLTCGCYVSAIYVLLPPADKMRLIQSKDWSEDGLIAPSNLVPLYGTQEVQIGLV